MEKEKDIVIIGGGPGGYTAAIRAAQLGAGVLLVEAEQLGGTCLNKGCIPTKALYKNAQLMHELSHAAEFGVRLEGVSIDIDEMMQRKQRIIDRLKEGIGQLVKGNSIELIYGRASLAAKDKVKVIDSQGNKSPGELCADAVLVSVGREPNVEDLGLESLGIQYDRKGINVDAAYRTNVPGIYAIGDVIGGQMLAHVAAEEGVAAAEHIMGLKGQMNYGAVPGCVFTFPEIAAVGLSEEDAKEKGIDYAVSKFLFGANGKALTMGEEEGFVKVLAETHTKRILGVHIMGPHASDLIHEAVLAVEKQMSSDDIGGLIHAHPTLSEALMEAAAGVGGKAVHMLPKKNFACR
ncbi:MAG TPA: FAD-dependent oxidoreductase [Anaerovoracaceae bacterium]|nr:FAD-dependent oxidoreductase [Anaerovoracaceae bacterium]